MAKEMVWSLIFQETVVESLSLPDTKSSLLVLVMFPCMAGSVSVFEHPLPPLLLGHRRDVLPWYHLVTFSTAF